MRVRTFVKGIRATWSMMASISSMGIDGRDMAFGKVGSRCGEFLGILSL